MKLDLKTVFETPRMVARDWNVGFAEASYEIYSDPDVTRFVSAMHVKSIEEMRDRIEFIIARNENFPFGMGSYPCFLKSTGSMVGVALIKPLPDSNGKATDQIEIGWHLAKRQWGRGYATEYGRRLLQIGFDDLGLDELHAVVDPPNERSKRVAERIGMKHAGLTDLYYDGKTLDHFVIDRDMYENLPEKI